MQQGVISQNVAHFANTVVRASRFVSFVKYSAPNRFSVASMTLSTLWWQSAYCHYPRVCDLIYVFRYYSLTDPTTFSICWKDGRSVTGLSFETRNNRLFSGWNDTLWIHCRYSSSVTFAYSVRWNGQGDKSLNSCLWTNNYGFTNLWWTFWDYQFLNPLHASKIFVLFSENLRYIRVILLTLWNLRITYLIHPVIICDYFCHYLR